MLLSDTIAAISTPPGKGGVAVIRISGPDALGIAEKIFKPRGNKALSENPRMQIYGYILKAGESIDDGMATYFKEGSSYTGEATVEISCHGGMLISSEVLSAALAAGARAASAGEFTRRAFVNGRITLTEAEEIGLLLDAESYGQLKLSRFDSRARLGALLSDISTSLTHILSSVYARIDYPDEDLGELSERDIENSLRDVDRRIRMLLSTYKTGRAVREGIPTVIAGAPNAGKSTLYNILTGTDSAIVTDIAGTTRDVLEHTVSLGDVMLRLYDTAGIRGECADAVESIGIERSRERVLSCELVLALFDSSSPTGRDEEEFIELLKSARAEKIVILTKGDLESVDTEKQTYLESLFGNTLLISERDFAQAVSAITERVTKLFTDERIKIGTDAIISTARQNSVLLRAAEHISCALSASEAGLMQDIVSSDVELALGAVSELEGSAVSEAVVSDIFSRFCVGK